MEITKPNFIPNLEEAKREGIIDYVYRTLCANGLNTQVLNNNLHSLKMYSVPLEEMMKLNVGALYNTTYNAIYYSEEEKDIFITHELLHASSTIVNEDKEYSGFLQFDKNKYKKIGEGLNEGYTVLLDKRYFSNNELDLKYGNTYRLTTSVAAFLESVLTKEVMEKAYFNADLYGIVQLLSMYMNKKEISRFLHNVDKLLYYSDTCIISNPFVDIPCFKECYIFIGEYFSRKVNNLYENNEINRETYIECLENLKDCLTHQIRIGKHGKIKISLIPESKVKKICLVK